MKRCIKCARVYDDDALTNCPADGAALRPVVDPLVGRRVGGRYRIQRRLGQGGMSTVYLAEDVLSGEQVALKVLRQDLTEDRVQRDRFIREAKAIRRVLHENVVEVIDFDAGTDGLFYLIMEYVPGVSLHERLGDGPMPSRAALAVARQVLSALARTHRLGVVHRDLKPENILLVEDADGRERVKVLDFGIAKVRDFETLTGSLQIIGTPGYIAPEYIQAARIDGRADLFSLGVVLYEMVTGGRHPFDYKYHGDLLVKPLTDDPVPPSVRRPGVEPEVEALVLRALRKDPDQRFRDAFHMREAVDEVLAALDARDADPHGRPTTVAPPRGGVDTVSALEPPEDGPAAPSPVEHAPATTAFGRRPALLRPTPETPAFQPRRLTLAVAAVHESRERLTSATPPGAAPVAGWRERAAGRLAVLEGRVAAARWLAEEGGALRLALRQARAAHGARTDALAERVSHLGGEADGLALRRRVLIEHPESGRPGELAEVELALLAARRQQAVAARDLEQIRRDLDREHDRHAEALRDVLAALERALELVEACQQDLGDTLAGADGGGAGP